MNAISSYEKQYKESAADVICGEIFRHINGVITYNCCICQLNFGSGIDFENHVVDHFLVVQDETAVCNDVGPTGDDAAGTVIVESLPVSEDSAPVEENCATVVADSISDVEDIPMPVENKRRAAHPMPNAPTVVLQDLFATGLLAQRDDWTVTCHCCNDKFACQGLRDQHAIKKRVAYSKCSLCPAFFPDRLSRMQHRVLHYLPAAQQIRCPHCERLFDTKEALIEHIFKNVPPLELSNVPQPLVTHMLSTPPPKPMYECDLCGTKIKSKIRLEKHLLNHVAFNFDCATCGRHFKSVDILRRHMFSHSAEKLFGCSSCDRSYTHLSSLREHRKMHSNQRDYICHQCGKTYANSHSFKKHTKEYHDRIKDFVCTDCGDAFFTVYLLRDHVRAQHTLERPYVCNTCQKTFTSVKLLAVHARSHSDTQYQCRHCERLFKHRTNRWVHEKRKHLHFID